MMKISLKKGDVAKRSIPGAKGFFYPDLDGRVMIVREECVAVPRTGWQNRDSHVACHVSSNAFSLKDRYGEQPTMVVWLEKA